MLIRNPFDEKIIIINNKKKIFQRCGTTLANNTTTFRLLFYNVTLVIVIAAYTILVFTITAVISKSAQPFQKYHRYQSNNSETPKKSKSTIVSGYGSYRHPLLPYSRATTTILPSPTTTRIADDDNVSPMYILSPLTLKNNDISCYITALNTTAIISTGISQQQYQQYTKHREHAASLPLSYMLNITKQHQKEQYKVEHDNNLSSSSTSATSWIPIQGIYGVYILPSGYVIVWIVQSEPVYTAPSIAMNSNTLERNSSWWQIHRVSELYLTHITLPTAPNEVHMDASNDKNHSTTTSTQRSPKRLSRQQRLEEKRQLHLLRQALKDHDWYYVRSNNNVIPDMTRNIQQSFLLLLQRQQETKNETAMVQMDSNLAYSRISPPSGTIHMNQKRIVQNDTTSCLNIDLGSQKYPEPHFFWNEALIYPFLVTERAWSTSNESAALCRTLRGHVIPVTSAFCGVQTNLSIQDDNNDAKTIKTNVRYDQILISRRSRYRAGTRFTRRGADATGAVANFAETEQIIVVWKNETSSSKDDTHQPTVQGIMSFVQIRGSIPLRWSSPTDVKTYRPRVRIGTDPIAQARAFRNHLIDCAVRYTLVAPNDTFSQQQHKSIVMVNLIDKKSDQGRLGKAMDAVLNALLIVHESEANSSLPWLSKSFIEHIWFDFHAEVKSGRWHKLAGLLEQVKPSLIGQSYFLATPLPTDGSSNTIKNQSLLQIQKLQTGIVRTNCMDCLDRTNVVQSIFGRYMLFQQLADFRSFSLPFPYKSVFRKSSMSLPWTTGEVAHRLLWADNADAISRLYAGTPALKRDFTRTGKRTKFGTLDDGFNSMHRYYLNNFLDADRQEGVDLLTGHELFSNVNEFTVSDDDNFFVQHEQDRGINLQEAARKVLRQDFDNVAKSDSDANHVRIKVQRINSIDHTATEKLSRSMWHLDLRWLPGDLQAQVRQLTVFSNHLSDNHKQSLKDIDNRASSDMPWWVIPDSTAQE